MPKTQTRKNEMLNLYNKGYSCKQIGDIVGLSQSTVWYHLKSMGVELRRWQRVLDENVSYGAIHKWIYKHKPMSRSCEECGQHRKLNAANISGKYLRDISDFKWLCIPCHRKMDGHGERTSLTADRKRSDSLCSKGHDQRIDGFYKYARKDTRRGRYYRKCKKCQSEASRRYYVKSKLEPEE